MQWLADERRKLQQQLADYEAGIIQLGNNIPSDWPLGFLDVDYKDWLQMQIDNMTKLIIKHSSPAT
jgi:hypothetical protein